MKTIGLLGGMSWESTVPYYREINRRVAKAMGGLHSAKIVLYSVDFAEVEAQQVRGDWAQSARLLGDAARGLVAAGGEAIVICTNTMHKVAAEVEAPRACRFCTLRTPRPMRFLRPGFARRHSSARNTRCFRTSIRIAWRTAGSKS